MRRWAQIWSGLLLAGMCLAPSTFAQPVTVQPAGARSVATRAAAEWAPQTFTLDNGLRAVVLPDHRSPVVTHMLWYGVGSADEAPGKSGLAHFLEHLMFKATSTTEAGAFSRTVARNGGQDNAATSFDFTRYHFRIARDRLPLMMQMEADRMTNLQLVDSQVLPERKVVQEERRQVVDSDPAAILDEMVWAKLYAGHPYAVPVIGHMNEVAALSSADALDWYRTWYGPENAILVVAGDITAEELKPLAEGIYGHVPRRGDLKVRVLPAVRPLQQNAEVSYRDPKVRQPVWSRNWLGVPVGDPDMAALQLGVQVLGGGRTSRLYRELVEGGKAVKAWAYSYELEAAGPIAVSAMPAPDVTIDQLRAATLGVVDTFLKEGPTAAELDRARSMLAASDVFRRDNQMEMATWYGGLLSAGLSLDQIAALKSQLAGVTPEQVRIVMRKYLAGPAHVDATLLPGPR